MKKQIIISIIIFVALGIFLKKSFRETSVFEIPNLMANSRSKEFCSCFYVLKKKKEDCLERIKKGYPLFKYEINEVEKSVSFSNPFASSTSKYNQKEPYGCSLL